MLMSVLAQMPHFGWWDISPPRVLQLYMTNQSQEVSPFLAGDHKAQINRRAQRHDKHKTEKTYKIHKRSTALERLVKCFTEGLIPVSQRQPHP